MFENGKEYVFVKNSNKEMSVKITFMLGIEIDWFFFWEMYIRWMLFCNSILYSNNESMLSAWSMYIRWLSFVDQNLSDQWCFPEQHSIRFSFSNHLHLIDGSSQDFFETLDVHSMNVFFLTMLIRPTTFRVARFLRQFIFARLRSPVTRTLPFST